MLKIKGSIFYDNGTIYAKCQRKGEKITLKLIYEKWISTNTGEVYAAVVNVDSGRLMGFLPMTDRKHIVYADRKQTIY